MRDSSRASSLVTGPHGQTQASNRQDQYLAGHNEALKRGGKMKIWFDPEMSRDAVPTGKCGRQQNGCDVAIRMCPNK